MSDHSDSPAPGGRNLLLQTGEDGDCEEAACMDLLGVADPAGVDVLFVTFTKSADDRLEALKRHADAPPARVGVVSVQVGGSNGGDRVGGAGGPTVRRISDPSDLTGVGIAISEFLSAWSGDGNRTVVCFESLTALLQYVDASRVFQFCNEITSKFEQAGATAHFHITPEAHERQELSVLSSLFDGRVSAADLGYGADAVASAGAGADAGAPDADPESTDAQDGSSGDAPSDSGSTAETEDPFEYAGDDGAADPADDVASTAVDESTAAGAAEPGDGTDAQPEGEPADLVSSVIAGQSDVDGDDADADDADDTGAIDGDDAEDPEGGRPDAAPDVADVTDVSDASADGELPETEDDGHPEGADESRPAATARQAEHEGRRRRLQYVGPGGSEADGPTGGDGGDDRDPAQATGSDDPAEGGDKYAFYQRTTATVVGVVVMLVLISFLSAAMPVPVTPDDAVDGADVSSTATPEEVAAANETVTETATATEDASTLTPTATATATATPTPTPDSSTSSSSSSGSSDDGSTGDDGSTSDPTATPTSTPTVTATPTPTDTPSDDTLIDDTLDTTDDLL